MADNMMKNRTPIDLIGPASKLAAANTSDTADLTGGVCRGLLVGTAGAATIIDGEGNVCEAVPLQQGYNPIGVQRIYATGLTASNIWALY